MISVSLDTGCYRHIQISSQDTLCDLSDAILDAFSFDNDHMHAFYMDNEAHSHWGCYYSDELEEADEPLTTETTLEEAGAVPGKKFKYLFDFGDHWVFQCRVLKELDEKTDFPQIIRSVGEAPEQVPDWDDDDPEEDSEDED